MGSAFAGKLADRAADPDGRRWLFVPYDQLSDDIGPLADEPPSELGIVLVESPWKAAQRPYHKQKLALVLTSLRHFALEQAERGVAVRHVVHEGPYAEALAPLVKELGPLRVQEPAERELRADLAELVRAGGLEVLPHDGWLTTEDDFEASRGKTWRMDSFYRHVRQRTGILMEDGEPEGGQYSFDAENRRPWKGEPPAPDLPRFRSDDVTSEVCELVETRFGDHPGELDAGALPASRSQVDRLWTWALESCLEHFGPYEDAMSDREGNLFHTRVSALLNLHRLLPRRVVADVAGCDAPLASREGFVRQVLGWREFVRHVHRATDGFRDLPQGVRRNHLGARRKLPEVFWGDAPSGMRCLDRTVEQVWEEGYSHHITRLMVLSNLATLLDVDPRALSDWFWVAYTDAYDWVVEPNVLGMGTYSLGPLFTTKPYVSGSAYIARMSDHCGSCALDPKRDCPITRLYWAFLERHRDVLEGNPRIAMPMRSLAKREEAEKRADAETFEKVSRALARGAPVA